MDFAERLSVRKRTGDAALASSAAGSRRASRRVYHAHPAGCATPGARNALAQRGTALVRCSTVVVRCWGARLAHRALTPGPDIATHRAVSGNEAGAVSPLTTRQDPRQRCQLAHGAGRCRFCF
ncbi:hypothetical protein [Paraburkholderia caballeronis]|uniref:hypothetical protein n=1 Tax=Paraburkholderia caballeronis TaxID=416943 RepID=UPI0014170131|nr:hypothetical protein [Paraburkholderia caballeronis]